MAWRSTRKLERKGYSYIDVAHFLACVEALEKYPFCDRDLIGEVQKAFLEAYEVQAGRGSRVLRVLKMKALLTMFAAGRNVKDSALRKRVMWATVMKRFIHQAAQRSMAPAAGACRKWPSLQSPQRACPRKTQSKSRVRTTKPTGTGQPGCLGQGPGRQRRILSPLGIRPKWPPIYLRGGLLAALRRLLLRTGFVWSPLWPSCPFSTSWPS